MSGAIQKFAMDGHAFAITTDSDLNYNGIKKANTESQMTSKGPHAIVDLLVQKVTGQTGQWNMGSADEAKFIELVESTAGGGNRVSCSFITAEGYKVTTGTAYIVLPNVDGVYTTREGKTEFEVHCDSWTVKKSQTQ